MEKEYKLFISHSWNYSDAYDGVIKLLNKADISFVNHSVPKDDPIHTNGTDKELREAIRNKMRNTSCLIILAGVYSTYSRWINEEVEIAKSYGKKIIAIEPWASERTSKFVKDNADVIVKWQSSSLISAIKG